MDRNQAKTRKNRAREWKRIQKPVPGSSFQVRIIIRAQFVKVNLEELSNDKNGPRIYFSEKAELALKVSQNTNLVLVQF